MSAFTPSPERGSLNGATAKILFAGDHADMPLVYSARDAVALPSLKHESFGRSAVGAAVSLDFHTMSSTDLLNALRMVINDTS